MPRALMLLLPAFVIVVVGAAISADAQENRKPTPGPFCSIETIAGDWAFNNHGKTPMGEFNGVGMIRVEKDGTVTGQGWRTVGGAVSSEFSLTGTTTVTEDCLSTGVFTGTPPFHCVVFANRTKQWCVYEAPLDVTVVLEKISRP